MEKVTVIIPVYNGEKYIDHCLDLVLGQTYDCLEVIVVDDGSTDKTYDMAKRISEKDERVKLIHQENGGVSAARNSALRVMTGKYVVFIDVDDEIEPDYVSTLAALFKSNETGLAICGYRIALRGGESASDDTLYTFDDEVVSVDKALESILLFRHYNPSIWNKMFLTDIIRENGLEFDTSIAIGEDMLFLVKYCMKIEKCAVCGQPNYIYYINPGGAMLERKASSDFKEKWLSEWTAILNVERELSAHGHEIHSLKIKKVRTADKLISIMAQYHYKNDDMKKQMLSCIRSSLPWSMKEKDYSKNKKISIFLNCISPALAYNMKHLMGKA